MPRRSGDSATVTVPRPPVSGQGWCGLAHAGRLNVGQMGPGNLFQALTSDKWSDWQSRTGYQHQRKPCLVHSGVKFRRVEVQVRILE